MMTIDILTNLNPGNIGLTISQNIKKEAWNLAKQNSHDISRWQSFLNLMTLKTCLPWLEEILADTQVNITINSDNELLELNEFVNGFAVTLDKIRLIFIPSENDDLGEIIIPQEWVDIPDFAGDYYIAVQVNPDENWLRIWGYTTYDFLKNEAEYDIFTRSYSLEEYLLDEDIIFLLITTEYQEKEHHFIPELGLLTVKKATQILQKLKVLKDYSLRLLIPFPEWGLIFSHPQYRQELYQSRQPLNLNAWINYNFSQAMISGWCSLEQLGLNLNLGFQSKNGTNGFATRSLSLDLNSIYYSDNDQHKKLAIEAVGKINRNSGELPNAIAALTHVLRSSDNEELRWSAELSLRNLDPHNQALGVWRGKIIDLGLNLNKIPLVLVLGTLPKTDGQTSIFLRVYPRTQDTLPENLMVKIIDQTGTEFERLLSRSLDNYLQYKFWASSGEQFSISLSLGDAEITETFVI